MKNPYKELSKYTVKRLEALEAFGMGPKLKLSGFERDVIDVIEQLGEPGFYDLCECFDMKPSKMEKKLLKLEEKGLVVYMDAAGKVYLTDIAQKYILNYRKESKSEKKLRAFIESLNDEETEQFLQLVDEFKFEESEEAEACDKDNTDADNIDRIIIVDTTEAEYDEPTAEEEAPKADEPEAAEAEAKADEAETKAAETKADEAETKADEAEAKADEAETKADEAEAKADENEAKADEAEAKADEAKDNAEEPKTEESKAEAEAPKSEKTDAKAHKAADSKSKR